MIRRVLAKFVMAKLTSVKCRSGNCSTSSHVRLMSKRIFEDPKFVNVRSLQTVNRTNRLLELG